MTTTEIETIITTLETQLSSGKASVRFKDREIRYNSAESIVKALSYFRSLQTGDGTSTDPDTAPRSQIRLFSRNGY